ncbi:cytochrome P450 3A19-like [Saccostrea echinata]|uniref:cytochrome P450 3A19-like n=1 Tax=Saccostrea echinata TaxID=191078 RepID=UPI002A8292CF|nr:cytochrome P450 3A19-like [Saccostrea echinata]
MPPLYSLLCKLVLDIDRQNKYCLYFKNLVEQAKKLREDHKKRNDLLHCLLDAHKETDLSETEQLLEYKVNREQWKKKGLTTEEVNGNFIMFIFAGYETTSTVLTFTAYCLATNPEYQDKLIPELDTSIGQHQFGSNAKDTPDYDNIQKLEYLDYVIKESIPRNSSGNGNIRSVSIFALHRSPKYWEEPEKYNLDRFLAKNKSNLTPYMFLPFGLGPRSCIAMRLSYLEAKCALVTILQKYKFLSCDKTEIPLKIDFRVLLKPKNRLFLKMEERKLS